MRSGYAAIIGKPNVGKSTLMNRMIGQKIAITSPKPQTTRSRIETVYTDERGQIVFLDTPGIHRAKTKLGRYMDDVAEGTLKEADVIVWLAEPVSSVGDEEAHIIELLKRIEKSGPPLIFVMNKADKLKDEKELSRLFSLYGTELSPIKRMGVSAKTGEGVEELLSEIFALLPEGPLFYDEDTVTTIPMRTLAEELIREKALRLLSDEVPHGIAVVVEEYKERPDGSIFINADIICERDSHKGMIIGKGGQMLKRIGMAARKDLEQETETKVDLRLFVKVRKGWRDDRGFIRSFGYDMRKL